MEIPILDTFWWQKRRIAVEPGSNFARSQRRTIVLGILSFVLMIVVLQFWLLTATMEAYLGGERSIVIPAGLASLGCFVLVLGLLRYFRRLE